VIADSLVLAASMAVLMSSGDQFVVGLARLATAMRVRPSVVGSIVGGLGASLPELFVSGVASYRGNPQLAVGNLVGSNVAHICLALALAAMVAPVRVDSRTVRREAPISVAAVVLLAVLLGGGLSWIDGVILAGGLAMVVPILVANARLEPPGDELEAEVGRFFGGRGRPPLRREIVRSSISLAGMILGSELLVRSATSLASRLGIGQGFVGLTIVAVGTSVPLVAITVQAARRGHEDLLVGHVLGSNLFVALAGGALVAFIHGGPAASVGPVAIWLMAASAIAAWALMARGSRLTRWEAAALIVAYGISLPFLTR
jgi:cation:H+ antiporter